MKTAQCLFIGSLLASSAITSLHADEELTLFDRNQRRLEYECELPNYYRTYDDCYYDYYDNYYHRRRIPVEEPEMAPPE